MKKKRDTQAEKERRVDDQVDVMAIAMKLESIGALLQHQDNSVALDLSGIGMILTDLAEDLNSVISRK